MSSFIFAERLQKTSLQELPQGCLQEKLLSDICIDVSASWRHLSNLWYGWEQ